MSRRPEIDLFCEDGGHELFARALVERLVADEGTRRPIIQPRSTRGGLGRTLTELKAWQRKVRASIGRADLLLVLIDANGEGHRKRQAELRAVIEPDVYSMTIVACPDPHVEAWCAADPAALRTVLGAELPPRPARAGRDAYKAWLGAALRQAGVRVLNDPLDIAAELVPAMDLFRAGKADPSFRHAVDDIRGFLKAFAERREGA
ncbi:MAG: hypothetical protein EA398_17655 [Deltaproteobacteria bacterium]|nr:MAG: hypothetical protein EA398_17655 [Deltaproteobacteria bacterium]